MNSTIPPTACGDYPLTRPSHNDPTAVGHLPPQLSHPGPPMNSHLPGATLRSSEALRWTLQRLRWGSSAVALETSSSEELERLARPPFTVIALSSSVRAPHVVGVRSSLTDPSLRTDACLQVRASLRCIGFHQVVAGAGTQLLLCISASRPWGWG